MKGNRCGMENHLPVWNWNGVEWSVFSHRCTQQKVGPCVEWAFPSYISHGCTQHKMGVSVEWKFPSDISYRCTQHRMEWTFHFLQMHFNMFVDMRRITRRSSVSIADSKSLIGTLHMLDLNLSILIWNFISHRCWVHRSEISRRNRSEISFHTGLEYIEVEFVSRGLKWKKGTWNSTRICCQCCVHWNEISFHFGKMPFSTWKSHRE